MASPVHAPSVPRPLRMIMFGKPGAGKGTLSSRLVERYEIEPVSTGDLLRAEVRAQSALGKEVEAVMAGGGIVDDRLVLQLVSNALKSFRERGIENWILDGFPRTLRQGQMLDPILQQLGSQLNLVVNLDVPDEVILSRIADRWIHLPSGRVYNLGYNKPKVAGRDDVTGEPLSKRSDDKPEVATRRLQTFYETTSPLLDYYSSRARAPLSTSPQITSPRAVHAPAAGAESMLLTSISGTTSDEIWPHLENLVVEYFGVQGKGTAGSSGGGSVKERIDVSSMNTKESPKTKLAMPATA
ncbi:adenylate kinase [Clavulina sp. PMI_390]|nr:adenylate kinase [Clavulina sp. PMI_390]